MTEDDKKGYEGSRRELPEDFYRSIVENTRNVVWVISRKNQQIVFINRDFCGVTKEKIMEQGLSAIWPRMTIASLESLLGALEKAAAGESTENLQTQHKNIVSGEDECYLSSVFPLRESGDQVSHVQVSSREVTPLITAQRTIGILSSVSEAVQNNMFSSNLFKLVGERLKKYDIRIVIFLSYDLTNARMAYSNIPRRNFRKALSLIGRADILTGTPIDSWPGLKRTIRHKKAEFFDDPFSFMKSRLKGSVSREYYSDLIGLLGLSKAIVAPMIENSVAVGSFAMFSPFLTETDLAAVKTFAVQFTNALLNSQLHEDTKRLRRYLESLLRNTQDGVFAADGTGSIVSWNRAAGDLLGFRKKNIIGEKVRVVGLHDFQWKKMLEGSMTGLAKTYENVNLCTRDGSEKSLTIIASPIERDNSKEPGVVFFLRRSAGSE